MWGLAFRFRLPPPSVLQEGASLPPTRPPTRHTRARAASPRGGAGTSQTKLPRRRQSCGGKSRPSKRVRPAVSQCRRQQNFPMVGFWFFFLSVCFFPRLSQNWSLEKTQVDGGRRCKTRSTKFFAKRWSGWQEAAEYANDPHTELIQSFIHSFKHSFRKRL